MHVPLILVICGIAICKNYRQFATRPTDLVLPLKKSISRIIWTFLTTNSLNLLKTIGNTACTLSCQYDSEITCNCATAVTHTICRSPKPSSTSPLTLCAACTNIFKMCPCCLFPISLFFFFNNRLCTYYRSLLLCIICNLRRCYA